jgi:pimeloyl-ACP methyl ester carboxylesterase
MNGYTDSHKVLGKAFSLDNDQGSFNHTGISYRNFSFHSQFAQHLPASTDLPTIERDYLSSLPDKDIRENIDFRYPVFLPEGYKQTNRVIILLHGLNEKSWDKYLTWARELVLRTGHAVLLFPISFHMNRTPSAWINPRSMTGLSRFRENKYEDQACSTFANAAMSERLDNIPERFALSGYQSVMDLLNLVNHISSGEHPVFKEDTEIHFFGYSIGAFLSQVLMIANPDGIFDKSKFVLFAGGTVFSEINGISRFILDKQAFEQLRKYYLNQSSWRRQDLKSYVKAMNVKNVARAFMAMLSPDYFSSLRENVFCSFSDRLMVYALKEDQVFPEEHILKNFNCSGVWVNRLDFPYEYTHENPFPISKDKDVSEKVDESFDVLFKEVGNFLRDDSNYDF